MYVVIIKKKEKKYRSERAKKVGAVSFEKNMLGNKRGYPKVAQN